MFITPEAYHVIDIANKRQALTVVVEATSRKEVSDYLKSHGLAECGCFKEADEEIYRGICPVTNVISPKNEGE